MKTCWPARWCRSRTLDINVILTEKKQIIRRSKVLEYFDAEEDMSLVGGMSLLERMAGEAQPGL